MIDSNGAIEKVRISDNKQDFESERVLSTNSGQLNDLIVSPISNGAITVGDDGAVRLWDFVGKR